MNKAAITAILVSGLILFAGCKSKEGPPPGPAPAGAAVSTAEINSAKLNNATVPQAVQSAFMHDNPKAAIETVQLRTDTAGRAFYQITYMAEGRGGTSSYFADGSKVP